MNKDIHNTTIRKIRQYADLENRDILEIGCGDGRITASLSGDPRFVVGIDPSETDLRRARSAAPGAHHLLGSGTALMFPDETFDLVLFTLSLHHQDSAAGLSEAQRVLKPGGRILVLEPVAESEIDRVCRVFENESGRTLRALYAVMASGFEIETREIFDLEWSFPDRGTLHRWACDYYDTPFSPELAGRMDAVLGEKAFRRPLAVGDRLLLMVLRP